MIGASVFTKDLIEAVRRSRGLAIKIIYPSIFSLPLLLSKAPISVAAGVITMIILMIGVFGTGMGLTKDRSEGVIARLLVTPVSSFSVLIGQVASNALLELVQIAPILALVMLISNIGLAWKIALVAIAVLTILSANLLGVLASSLATNTGDIHLYSTLIIFPLIGISGIFRTPPAADTIMAKVSLISPLTYFYQVSNAVLGQAPKFDAWGLLIGSMVVVAILVLMTYLLSDKILRRELA